MRLTLRTLLAWLDDTLPPTQVREIGKQVSESPFAQELVERIHRVTRQRRLTVPSKTGPEATDPNLVASYLDNDLEPEQVAEYEKKCLTSDVNLAEAASVHQILSLLGQKVQVPGEAKTRMYQMVKGREAILPPQPNGIQPVTPEPVTKPIHPWVVPEPPQRPLVQRFGPVAACLLLIALLSWSAWKSLTPVSRDTQAQPTTPAASAEAGLAAGTETEAVPPAAPDLSQAPVISETVTGPPKEAEKPEIKSRSGQTDEQASASKKTVVALSPPESKAEQAVPISAPTIPPGSVGVLEKTDGVILRYNTDKREWVRITEATGLNADDRILCLAPFRARIALGKLPVTLVGETQLRLSGKAAGQDAAFELVHGRVLIAPSKTQGTMKIEFANRSVAVDLPSVGTLGIERVAQWRFGQPVTEPPSLVIHASAGQHSVAVERDHETLIGPGSVLVDPTARIKPRTEKILPSWLTEAEPSNRELKLRDEFLHSFSADRPVLADIVAATEDEREEMKRLSIAAVRALGDLSLLTPILDRQDDAVSRRVTIEALRDYLSSGPEALKRLREQLKQDFGENTSVIVEKLLTGFSGEESAVKETLPRLVELLSPRTDSIGIRELALDNLKILTGRGDLGYNADDPEGEGLQAWRTLLNQGELRLAPKRKSAKND